MHVLPEMQLGPTVSSKTCTQMQLALTAVPGQVKLQLLLHVQANEVKIWQELLMSFRI